MANCYCKNCGMKYSSVQALTTGACNRHPDGRGKHQLYEGSEKQQYVCKYCGMKYSSLQALTAGNCNRHPDGRGKHSPAL